MSKGLSATQRTLRALRSQGRIVAVTEKWNAFAGPPRRNGTGRVGVRQDLFGFVDVLALCPGRGFVGVQSCSQSHGTHLKKIREQCFEAAEAWLACGGVIELWTWRKVKVIRGGKAVRWEPRIEEITLETLKGEQSHV